MPSGTQMTARMDGPRNTGRWHVKRLKLQRTLASTLNAAPGCDLPAADALARALA